MPVDMAPSSVTPNPPNPPNLPAGSGLDALRGVLGGGRSGSTAASSGASGATDGRNAFKEFMSTFGAVPVSAKNMHRLLQNKEAVLLFPGEPCRRWCSL